MPLNKETKPNQSMQDIHTYTLILLLLMHH